MMRFLQQLFLWRTLPRRVVLPRWNLCTASMLQASAPLHRRLG